jgi:hypothetical protein
MKDPTDTMELARTVALETGPTDSVGLIARRFAWALIVQHEDLEIRRRSDLSPYEIEALRGCSVHCQDEVQLALATSAIDKITRSRKDL